jgi:hypothetical protein
MLEANLTATGLAKCYNGAAIRKDSLVAAGLEQIYELARSEERIGPASRTTGETQAKRVAEWRMGERRMSPPVALAIGSILRARGAAIGGELLLYAAGHFAQYLEVLRTLAQSMSGAVYATDLHVYGELFVEAEVAEAQSWYRLAAARKLPQIAREGSAIVADAVTRARAAIRELNPPNDLNDGPISGERVAPIASEGESLIRYAIAGAREPSITVIDKQRILRTLLRLWRERIQASPRFAWPRYLEADTAFESLLSVSETAKARLFATRWTPHVTTPA